jgi:hypothetical protein
MNKAMLTDKWLRLIRRIKALGNTPIPVLVPAYCPSTYPRAKGQRANHGVPERSP